jgi:hypothetical protein
MLRPTSVILNPKKPCGKRLVQNATDRAVTSGFAIGSFAAARDDKCIRSGAALKCSDLM